MLNLHCVWWNALYRHNLNFGLFAVFMENQKHTTRDINNTRIFLQVHLILKGKFTRMDIIHGWSLFSCNIVSEFINFIVKKFAFS